MSVFCLDRLEAITLNDLQKTTNVGRSASIILLTLLAGCGFSNFDRDEQYLSAGSIDRVSIPEPLDQPDYVYVRVIPEVNYPRNISGRVV